MYDISIVVPIYNMAWCLEKHIESLLKIEEKSYEIILVDDGSTDNSLNICRSFESEQVKVLHKHNGGISSARNAGLKIAKGKYVYFYDPDDEIEPGIFNTLAFGEADLIVFGYDAEYYIDNQFEHKIEYIPETRFYKLEEIEKYFALTTKIQFPIWNKIFKRDLIEQYQICFPAINCWEDACFVMTYLRYAQGVQTLSQPYYHYRIEQKRESLSKLNFVSDRKKQYLALYQANVETLQVLNIKKKDLYVQNNVRLLYNAAADFFYNTTPESIGVQAYDSYYTELVKNQYIIQALDDSATKKKLKLWEAKIFDWVFRRYKKNNNIKILTFCYYTIGKLFLYRKGRK